MLRKTNLVVLASAIVLGASACNTVKGVGRDIESVGRPAPTPSIVKTGTLPGHPGLPR